MSQREQVELERIRAQLRILAEEVDALSPDHGTLGGLDDDDHTQYALADGSRGAFLKSSDIGSTVQGYDADTPTVAASTVEMEAGTETARRSMSPADIAAAIAALGGGGGGGGGGAGALRVVVPASMFDGVEGSSTYTSGNNADSRFGYWPLDASSGEAIFGAFDAAAIDEWEEISIYLWTVTPSALAANDIVVTVGLHRYDDGDDAATPSTIIAENNAVVSITSSQWVVERHEIGTGYDVSAITAVDNLGAYVRRSGGNGSDTYTGDIGIVAVEFVRTDTPGAASVADGTWEVIETLDVTAGTTIDFTSIPAGYGALKAVGYMAGSSAGADIEMTFNGDTGANYDRAILYNQASGSTAGHFVSSGVSSIEMAILSTAGIASFEVLIPGYDVTGGKRAAQGMSVRPEASGVPIGFQCYGQWDNTADAIDQVTFTVNAGTMTGKILLLGLNTTPAAIDRTGWKVIEVIEASAASSVDFTSIPDGYDALKLVADGNTSGGGASGNEQGITFNGDTGANYGRALTYTSGSSALGITQTSQNAINIWMANLSSAWEVTIPDYANTTRRKNLIGSAFISFGTSPGTPQVRQTGGSWNNTAAINQVTITPAGGTVTGRFVLMGLLTE